MLNFIDYYCIFFRKYIKEMKVKLLSWSKEDIQALYVGLRKRRKWKIPKGSSGASEAFVSELLFVQTSK